MSEKLETPVFGELIETEKGLMFSFGKRTWIGKLLVGLCSAENHFIKHGHVKKWRYPGEKEWRR